MKFSLYTVVYWVLVLVSVFIISAIGFWGNWIGHLVISAMFLLYLYYIAVPAPSVLVLYPETHSGIHGGWRPIRDGAGHLAALGIFLGAILTTFALLVALSTCFASAVGCNGRGFESAMAAERETVQTAMNAMMADKDITTMIPNDDTTGSLGVNTWTGEPEGANTAPVASYMKKNTTTFYYCWDNTGNVYAQNKKDGVEAKPKDAEKRRPWTTL